MRIWAVSLWCCFLPPARPRPRRRPPDGLFNDRLFLAPSERISAEDVFALSDEMKQYLNVDIAPICAAKAPARGSSTPSRRAASSSSTTTR